MNLIRCLKEDSSNEVKKVYSLLESLKKEDFGRIEKINLLYKTNSLYRKIANEKGKLYCLRNLPGVDKTLRELQDKIIDYVS